MVFFEGHSRRKQCCVEQAPVPPNWAIIIRRGMPPSPQQSFGSILPSFYSCPIQTMADTPETTPPFEIYTIGHSNVPAGNIIELLERYEIKTLVDVRSSPYSQYVPQFNRETFEHTLRQAGIDYRYAGEYLGGRPKDPTCYKNGRLPDGQADFLHLVDYPAVMTRDFFQKGIQRLLELAGETRVSVMCSEEDPAA